jgi:RNA polymerase sigma-70 factor (ECF subfamily)
MALLYRHHVQTQARSVRREADFEPLLSDASAAAFAERLLARETSAGQRLLREEARAKVRAALDALRPADREILVLRFLEQMSVAEIAAILGLGEDTVRTRQRRALERFERQLAP